MAAAKPVSQKSDQKSKKSKDVKAVKGADSEGWPGAFGAIQQILGRMKANPQPAVFFALTYLIFGLASSIAQSRAYGSKGYIAYEDVLELVFLVSVPAYSLALAKGRPVSISEVMEFNPRTWLVMAAVVVMAAVAIFCSIILLVFPVIWVAAWLGTVQFAVLEDDLGPIEAIKESKRLLQNHKMMMWGIFGATVLLAVPEFALAYIPYADYITLPYNEIVGILVGGATAMLFLHLSQTVKE